MAIIDFIKIRKIFIRLLLSLVICSCGLRINAETQTSLAHNKMGIIPKFFQQTKEKGGAYKTKLEMKYYEELLKKNPKDISLLETYAQYLKDHGYYEKSAEMYNKLIKLTKNDKYKEDLQIIKSYKSYTSRNKIFLEYIEQAKSYEAQGNISKANQYYLKASYIFPDRYEVNFGLAKTYSWMKNPQLAMKYYTKALEQSPDNVDLLTVYAEYLKSIGNYDKSEKVYNKLLSLTKDKKYKKNLQEIITDKNLPGEKKLGNKPAQITEKDKIFLNYINQAIRYESQGQIKKANEYYLKAQKIYPNKFETNFGLAKTYGWLGKNKLANYYYQKLLKVTPANPDLIAAYNKFLKESKTYKGSKTTSALYSMKNETNMLFSEYIKQAQVYESQAQIEKANEYYLMAQKLDSSRYEAKLGLAKTYGWLHKDKLAMKYYKELLKQTPGNTQLLSYYANYLRDTGDYSQAMEIYQKLLATTKDEKYNLDIANVFLLQKDYETSLKMYMNIYDKNPNTPEVKKSIALLYFILGDFDKSSEFYQKYLAQTSDAESILNYSKALFYSKHVDQAQEVLENYVKTYPNDPEGLSALADIYMSQKKLQNAMSLVNRAIIINPDSIKFKIQSAKVDIAARNYLQAENTLCKLLKTNPNDSEIIENLGDAYFFDGEFNDALTYYQSVPDFENNKRINFKIAQSLHYNKDLGLAECMYNQLLNDSEYSDKARIGIAEIRISQDKPLKARKILNCVLEHDPENIQAKKNLAISWYVTGDNLTAIKILKKLPKDDTDVTYNLAKAYNKIERNDLALDLLECNPQDNAQELRKEILMQIKPAVEPFFDLYHMSGNANAGKYFKMGGNGYYYVKPNVRLIGTAATVEYRNVTDIVGTRGTILTGGVEGRLNDHLGFHGSAGYEFFSNDVDQNIVLAKALLKWYPNDVVSWTGGYIRSLDEIDSYMSAAGVVPTTGPFAGQLVGRIIDNKFVSDFAFKLPHKFYAYGGFHLGYKYGSNSPPNTYSEIPAGFGKVIYSGKESRPVNQILLGYDCYYTAYSVDRSGFGGANLLYNPIGSDGGDPEPTPGVPGVGGYFSPTFFLANKFPITIKGTFRETKLKYVLSAFWGLQTIQGAIGLLGNSSMAPGTISSYQYFGYSAGLRYNEKGRVSLALDYIFNNYMTVAQHLFKASLLVRF